MKLVITPEVKALGINVCMVVVRGASISNKSNPLEKRKKEAVASLLALDTASHPVLQAYRELHAQAGLEGQLPPAQHLINLAQKNGRLPNINTAVDCYNLVSALTGLSIGAHDLAHVKGDLTFRLTNGSERYTPLGESEPIKVAPGEYAAMDDEKIICRMDVKQCNETKVTKETGAFLVYVQGNKNTELSYIEDGLRQVSDLLKEICGGTYEG